jgi:diadenosine tetraphosphate (Ap4A) HIT family hydrolase
MTAIAKPPTVWMPRGRWESLVRGENCPLCAVIQSTERADEVAITVADLALSRLRLWKNQFVQGYCVLVCSKHVREPYHLTAEEQSLFFGDMMRAGQALERVFNPVKMNFQLLGNEVPHLHAHLMPRYYGDPAPCRPIDPGARVITLTAQEYQERIRLVRLALEE